VRLRIGVISVVSATPNEAALLEDHAKHDPVAQVENLLWLDPVLLISACEVLKEATEQLCCGCGL
jgi:hypothetical protein